MADILSNRHLVFIDGCAVNRFALLNIDPSTVLAGSPFALAVTPNLEAEYGRALDHLFVPPYVKTLVRGLLARAVRVDPPAPVSTDAGLVALSRTCLIVSDDAALIRAASAGIIAWADVEARWRADLPLLDLFRERATRLSAA